MRSNRTVLIVLAALCLSAAGFALWPIFGPDAAAMARRDDLRLGDLRQLESRVECIAHFDDGTLPSAITPNENCPATSEPTDPGTGAPYTYTRIDAKTYQICGAFETDLGALPPFMSLGFDPASGCFSYTLPD